jgi:hypothetical protein
MMDVLAHDIMRYEMLSEQDEYKALASVLQGNESEDFEFELQEVQLQPLPELQAVDDQFESEDPGAQSEEKDLGGIVLQLSDISGSALVVVC